MSTELERIAVLEQIVADQTKILGQIATDVRSLLGSRNFARGAMWLAAGISGVVSVLIGWLKS